MFWVVAFAGSAAALLLLSPLLLTAGRWQVRRPRTAMTLWFGAFFAGCALAMGSLLAAPVAGMAASDAPSPLEAVAVSAFAWVSLGIVGAVVALVSVAAEPLIYSYRDRVNRLVPVAVSREDRGRFTLVRFKSDEPVACAIPGRLPEILVSTALETALTPSELRAVLAHEYAHLRHQHGWAVRIAEVNALCLPRGVRAGRALKRATLLLVELIADDAAAKQVGAANLANALTRLAQVTGDMSLELRAARLTMRRWPMARRRRVPAPIRI